MSKLSDSNTNNPYVWQVVSLRTEYLALDVLETEMLPSDVIKIKFYRPPNLKYLSGMFITVSEYIT